MRKTTKCLCRMAVCLLTLSMLYPVGSQLKAATPVLSSQPSPESSASQNEASFKQLEAEHGARLGVYAWQDRSPHR